MQNIATHIFMQITQYHTLNIATFSDVKWNCCTEIILVFNSRICNYMLVCTSSKQGNGVFKCEA